MMQSILARPLLLTILVYSFLIYQTNNAASFNQNLGDIRSTIDKDNLQEVINKIKKIEINNEIEKNPKLKNKLSAIKDTEAFKELEIFVSEFTGA